jgi:hypothetical protein
MATSYSPSAAMVRTARNEIDRIEGALDVTRLVAALEWGGAEEGSHRR